MIDCSWVKESYVEWMATQIDCSVRGNVAELVFPIVNYNNDLIEVHVEQEGTTITLTDGGVMLEELSLAGVALTENRESILRVILSSFDLAISAAGELTKTCTKGELPSAMNDFIQALISVDHMTQLTASTVRRLFRDDVQMYLAERGVLFETGVRLDGASGLTHEFHFRLPRTDTQPDRYLESIRVPTNESLKSLMFSWQDTTNGRDPSSTLVAILDDSRRRVPPDFRDALTRTGIVPFAWSRRDELSRIYIN